MKKNPLTKNGLYRKAILLVMLVALMMSVMMIPASASQMSTDAYDTYTYWTAPGLRNAVSAAPMYEYKTKVTGASLGITGFSGPSDIFVDSKGLMYLSDKNNGRVVVINPDYTLNSIIENLTYKGETLDMTGLSSTFVTDDGKIFIADTNNARVIVTNKAYKVTNILYLPDDDVIPANFDYKPEKIAVNSKGDIYILSNGSYYGAVLYKPTGEFSGFYGSNSVTGSILDIFTRIYELYIMSDSQKENAEKTLPYCFTDISVDNDDFIYTATAPANMNQTNTGQLKKLSPGGTNVLKNKTTSKVSSAESFNFSDGRGMKYPTENGYYSWRVSYINSMDVDSYGYMYGLCRTYGHVLIYDQECNQLSVFGGGLSAGGQKGTFMKPVNIQVNDLNNDVLVVDELLNSFTVFSETEYGVLVKKAQSLTNSGNYVEAKPLWNEALKYDRNSQLAYRGLSRAALIEKEYETTLEYAELGFDRDTYASAYSFVRNDYLTDNFVWLFILVVAVIGGLIFTFVYLKKKERKLITNVKLSTMFQCVVHPFEGAKQVRYYDKGSTKLASLMLVLYFITTVCMEIYSGFMYVMLDKSSYSAMFSLIRTFGIVLLWTVVNWGLTTLFQGKGNMKQVYIVTCYALIPQIIYNVLITLLTNVLTPEEALVIEAIYVVCMALTAIMLCVGTMTVHEFGFFKFIVMTVVIIFGMLICVFVIMMVFVLIQQLFTFIGTIYKEISYR